MRARGDPEYGEIMEHWEIILHNREDFPSDVPLPDGYEYAEGIDPETARRLLEPEFVNSWRIPVERRIPGYRDDGVVAVRHGDEVIGVVYACDTNELGIKGYGEFHYLSVRPDHRRGGVFRGMYTELMRRAERMGLEGAIYLTDRARESEMYRRNGAKVIGVRPKPAPDPWWRRAARRLARPFRRG